MMMKVAGYFTYIVYKGLISHVDLLVVLAVFILTDYITEIMVAIVKHRVTRGIGIEGIFKRLSIFIIVFLASMIDVFVIQNGNIVTVASILFYLSYEGRAVLQHIKKLGLPFPKILSDTLEKIKDDGTNCS